MTQRALTLRHRLGVYRDAVALVAAEYDRDLRLDDIAHRVACSRRQLQRCFSEIGATTFRAHLNAVRMQRAAELLSTRTISVRDAARRVNYPYPAQFTKAFRRYHGVTPSTFRVRACERSSGSDGTYADPHDAIARRVSRLLRRCDGDHDDVLDASDVEEWVDRLGAIRGWEPGGEGYNALTALFVDQAFGELHALAGTPDGRIALDAMCDALTATARRRPWQVAAWAAALFELLDSDADGFIGPEDYRDLLASVCIEHGAADDAFAHVDQHAGGRLSRAGFSALYLQFFLSEEPDGPAAWLWGPVPVATPGPPAS